MEGSLFRKSAVDKVRSPEQLGEYMKVAGPGIWVILGGLIAVFAGFFIWGFLGTIPETKVLSGTVLAPAGEPMAVHAYVPIEEIKQITEGMNVQISPDYAPKEQFGYIYGTVASIGQKPVNADDLKNELGEDFALLSIPPGNVIEVVVSISKRSDSILWSTPKGASVDVIVGSTCSLTVITAERKPYELFFR